MPTEQCSTGPKVVDHLFRTGGGFEHWGRPNQRLFCGAHPNDGNGTICGKPESDHISPEAFAERERLRDAAPLLAEALEGILEMWGMDAHPNGLTDGCRICTVMGDGRAALRAARAPERSEVD